MNLSARNADAIVALTKGDAAVWHKINKLTFIIPDVVNLNDSGTYSDVLSKSAVFVGRLSCQKDIGSLLAIWRLVYQYHPDWKLHIYGEKGDIDDDLYNHLFATNIGVVVHAPIQHIHDEYKKHAILLLSSKYEPFGMVLAEAMSCGLPVVSFDCPYGPKDIITDSVDGFLIIRGDVDDYAKKVCLLMDNYNLRKNMGKKAIFSAQRFSLSIIMPKWYELFETLA
jgi:glycosyltransferase involved in cell wall biosynthesis